MDSPEHDDRAATPTDSTVTPLTIDELAEATGLTRRTIRFYVLSGVVTGPEGPGPSARYPASHVARLRLVRRWQDDGLQLAVIAQRLAVLSDVEVVATLGQAPLGAGRPASAAPSAAPRTTGTARSNEPPPPAAAPMMDEPLSDRRAPARSQWERFELEPGVELHVRRPLTTSANRRVQRLLELAASLRGSA